MIFFVFKDIEKTIGIDLKNYDDLKIITNSSPLADLMAYDYEDRLIINKGKYLSTYNLLEKYEHLISEDENPQIVVFKNSAQIAHICEKNNWNLLNPDYRIAYLFEKKISQYSFFSDNGINFPPSFITTPQETDFKYIDKKIGTPFIIQYNTSHTGEGTVAIKNEKEYEDIKQKFPKREIKISKFIKGETYTINISITPDGKILKGAISYQLTGIKLLTDCEFATVGNDWGIASGLDSGAKDVIYTYSDIIGEIAYKKGWRGLLGIDFIVDSDNVYVLEINARQAISASFETIIANSKGVQGPLDWHILSLSGILCSDCQDLMDLKNNNSQLFIRKKQTAEKIKTALGTNTPVMYDFYSKKIIKETYRFDTKMSESEIFIFSPFYDINQNKPSDELYRLQSNFSLKEKINSII